MVYSIIRNNGAFHGATKQRIWNLHPDKTRPAHEFCGAYLLVNEEHIHYHIHPLMMHEHAHSHADADHAHEHPETEHGHDHAPDIHHRHGHDE